MLISRSLRSLLVFQRLQLGTHIGFHLLQGCLTPLSASATQRGWQIQQCPCPIVRPEPVRAPVRDLSDWQTYPSARDPVRVHAPIRVRILDLIRPCILLRLIFIKSRKYFIINYDYIFRIS
jgi:hypothetical protein